MREFVELGSVPNEEGCVQVSRDRDYMPDMRAQCERYRAGLSKKHPGMKFGIKSNPHDFGEYLEVVVYYDNGDESEEEAAYEIENNLPATWEELEGGV